MTAPVPPINPSVAPREFLEHLYQAAVRRALPLHTLGAHLPPPPKGRTVVLGAGKAGGAMAAGGGRAVAGRRAAVGPGRHALPPCAAAPGGLPQRIEVVEAAHPVPDAAGQAGAAHLALERAWGRRPGAVPDLRRRLGPAVPAGARADAGRQAGREPGAAGQRRGHRRDELRAQAPLGIKGGRLAAPARRRAW
jgi:hypothetical protein